MRLASIKSKGILLLILLLILNCSVKKNYKILKIFFDGVPDPKSEKKEKVDAPHKSSKISGNKEPLMKSQHPDYVNNQCSKCHEPGSANVLVTKRGDLCFKCHQKNRFSATYIHGPVAVNDCLACHLPHQSQFQNLLLARDKNLCLQCHNPQDMSKSRSHELGLRGFCTGCHHPHVSDNRYFKRSASQ